MACCNVIMRNSLHEKPLVWSPRLVKIHSEWYSKNLWRLMNVNMIIEKPEFETQIQASWYLIEIFFFHEDWIDLFFSCDQAAFWLVQSFRPSVRPSVCLFVRLSHLFHHVPIIVSSWNFQDLLPWSEVMSMQKVKVRGQRSRSQRSTPKLAVSGL